ASAARSFGWSVEEAIGQRLVHADARFEVIGVVADTIPSASVPARPSVYLVPGDSADLYTLSVKLDPREIPAGMAHIEQTWRAVNPDEPMTSILVSDLVELGYTGALRFQKLVAV